MLYSIFQQILNMSLTASAVIAVVLLLRPLFRRTPRVLTYLLWAAVLFRLVCPVSFSADFALLFGFGTVNNRIQYLPTDLVRDSLPAALCAVLLGVFLLANPKPNTVPLVDAIEEFPSISNGSSVELRTNGAATILDGDSAAEAVFRFVQNLPISSEPVSKSRAEDRDKTYTVVLNSGTEVHFSDDFSTVWVDNHVKLWESLASPESVEFVLEDDLRVQIWKSPRVAAVKKGTAIADAVQYSRTNSGDYEAVVALLTENAK